MALDQQLYWAIQQLGGSRVVDTAMVYAAELLVFFVPFALLFLWFMPPYRRRDAVYVFFVAFAAVVVSYGLGLLYSHPSPVVFYEVVAPTGENAFPSQHATVMFGAAFGFLWRNRKLLSGIVGSAGVVTGIARVFVGEHWPVDIFGAVIAAGMGLFVVYIMEKRFEPVVSFLVDLYERIEDALLARVQRGM